MVILVLSLLDVHIQLCKGIGVVVGMPIWELIWDKMFRHQGKSRTLKHNFRIATVLSFVAGIVNVTGFLSIQRLTTNVTGHFAYFIYDVTSLEFWKGTVYFLYILFFLLGSFVASLLIELVTRSKKRNVFVLPTLLELCILLFVAVLGHFPVPVSTDLIACSLLFAMGVQNSFVTKISNAVVRTTHLTGLFTDLGIELSQLLFLGNDRPKRSLRATILLRLYIILFFFLGGILGGFLYTMVQLDALIFAAAILMGGLVYDGARFGLLRVKRKYMLAKKRGRSQ